MAAKKKSATTKTRPVPSRGTAALPVYKTARAFVKALCEGKLPKKAVFDPFEDEIYVYLTKAQIKANVGTDREDDDRHVMLRGDEVGEVVSALAKTYGYTLKDA